MTARTPPSPRRPAVPASAAALERALAGNPVLSTAAPGRLAALAAASEALAFLPGERILEERAQSNALYALLEGTVGVFYSSDAGVDVLVKVFGAPALFGEMEMLWRLPRLELVEAFTPVVVVRVPAAAATQLLEQDNAVCFALLLDVSKRLCIAAYHERALAFQEVGMRLAGVLLSFAEALGTKDGSGVVIEAPLTYEMLARCIGSTTRSVDRAFAGWRREGWLSKRRDGRYRVASLEALESHADPERVALFHRLR